MLRLPKLSVIPTSFAALCLSAAASWAATLMQEGSFVLGFSDFVGLTAEVVTFDPFPLDADLLAGVSLDVTSQRTFTESSAGEAVLSIALFDTFGPSPIQWVDTTEGTETLVTMSDLFDLGVPAEAFTAGPVDVFFNGFADEGSLSGLWYAGTDVPFLSLPEFGNVTLTYRYVEPTPVPVPGSLTLLGSGLVLLAQVSRRYRKIRPL